MLAACADRHNLPLSPRRVWRAHQAGCASLKRPCLKWFLRSSSLSLEPSSRPFISLPKNRVPRHLALLLVCGWEILHSPVAFNKHKHPALARTSLLKLSEQWMQWGPLLFWRETSFFFFLHISDKCWRTRPWAVFSRAVCISSSGFQGEPKEWSWIWNL